MIRRWRVHLAVQLVLVALLLILINHVSSAVFLRVDLTKAQDYTLSEAAREQVAHLEKPLVVRAYLAGDLNAPYHQHRPTIQAILEEFRAVSNGKMDLRIIDPSNDEQLQGEAERFGVSPTRYSYADNSRSEEKLIYMGISFSYGSEQRVLNPIDTLDTLEYEIARSIHALTQGEHRPVVGLLQGNGEPNLAAQKEDNPLGKLYGRLTNSYTVRQVELGGESGVPVDVDALLVIGPQWTLTERAQYQLDQYLMRGGSLGFFLAPIKPDLERLRASPSQHGLQPMLSAWGVKVGDDLMVDRAHNEKLSLPAMVGRQRLLVPVHYPLFPMISDIHRGFPITRGIRSILSPFSSSVTPSSVNPAVTTEVLWSTHADAGALPQWRDLRPEALRTRSPKEFPGPHPMAVVAQGKFGSYFSDRAIPAAPPAPDGSTLPEDPTSKLTSSAGSQLVVVGSADVLANNEALILNTVDWLVEDPALVAIRARTRIPPKLDVPENTATWRFWIPGVPALFWLGIAAFVRLRQRRAR